MTNTHEDQPAFLTPSEVAKELMVSPVTVRQWAQKGMIKAISTPGGHRRYPREEVDAFIQKHMKTHQDAEINTATRKLLIVDDDDQLRTFYKVLLENKAPSITVETAIDGYDAGLKIQRFNPDTVLLDLTMPTLDGFEVCKKIKADSSTRHIRVIAMTGYPSEENINRILEAGAEQCLTKPINNNALLNTLMLTEDSRKNSG